MFTKPLSDCSNRSPVYHPDRESEVRVTRGCGWVRSPEDQPCYRVDNADHNEIACQCFHDYCNAGRGTSVSLHIMIFSLFGATPPPPRPGPYAPSRARFERYELCGEMISPRYVVILLESVIRVGLCDG
ncbi:hypothetical protein EVAR_10216_1 [Eumeta japonica]|uniref:Protein sleepless n=1 Tax=Eumeta variegata TaxID=151549 RepID=A0A4C1TEM6_EUMVA|nr:hypothetical protein EVAR_10216_1 [Eumeta japonica]